MWQSLRNELHPHGLEVVTVGMDAAGAEACRPFIEAANPEHPSLIDVGHLTAEKFGVINIPNGVWIDEQGMIVRSAEAAPAPPSFTTERPNPFEGVEEIPQRMMDIFTEAMQIEADPAAYEAAVRDWVELGAESRFSLTPEQVIERSAHRDDSTSKGQAHFALATHFETAGNHQAAIPHFRQAHELVPDNFAYRRQAWSLEPSVEGPLARFWQGPAEGQEADWPYESEWLTDVRSMGPANYYPKWEA